MIVVDTNVIHYCWVRGENTEIAQAVRQRDPEWHAPILWRSELRSVLTAYDAEFVALATALSVPLVTGDKAVLKSFPDRALTMEAFLELRQDSD